MGGSGSHVAHYRAIKNWTLMSPRAFFPRMKHQARAAGRSCPISSVDSTRQGGACVEVLRGPCVLHCMNQ